MPFKKAVQTSLDSSNPPRRVVRPGEDNSDYGAGPHTPAPVAWPWPEHIQPVSFSTMNARWERIKERWEAVGLVAASIAFVFMSISLVRMARLTDKIDTSAFPIPFYQSAREKLEADSVDPGLPGIGNYGLGGAASTTSTPTTPEAKDQERQADLNLLHDNLETFYSANNYYPSVAELNDPIFRGANLPAVPEAMLQDPDGEPYAYQPTTQDGGPCDNFEFVCEQYTLIATLSDGTPFSLRHNPTDLL